jgi:hypothetical protein
MYNEVAAVVNGVIQTINPNQVSEYSWGTNRASESLIKSEILNKTCHIKFGRDVNNTGIGNNACYELIYTGNEVEEQIVGLFHCTDDMYGGMICWVSDIDDGRSTKSRTIRPR